MSHDLQKKINLSLIFCLVFQTVPLQCVVSAVADAEMLASGKLADAQIDDT